jgi:hypothetical protein|tara:strand:+ start:11476 stop:12384 length:909 start_codon:yes stop_codon:yes gene_type:complete
VSVTADFQAQFEALVTGLTEGETAFVRSEIESATVAFLNNVFTSLAAMISAMSKEAEVIGYAPNAFGYEGTSKRITSRWQIRKNIGLGKKPLTQEPMLFRGLSEKKGKTSLVQLLRRLGSNNDVGAKLYTGLGGLSLSPVATGSSALKPGLKFSKWAGKAYNPRTREYVAWKDAVIPAVNHYLRQGAVRTNTGARLGPNSRVSVEGRRGQISVQRALVEGLASAGINVSFLSKLNSFLGAKSDFDELADILETLGLIDQKERNKIGHLHKYKHAILLPYFGALLSSTGKNSLTAYLQREGVL